MVFFFGSGASIPAGISGVVGLVEDFKKWLEREGKQEHLDITEKILRVIQSSSRIDNNTVDIEKLLDITERLENADKDIFLDFYENYVPLLKKSIGYHLISTDNNYLTEEIKKFIKITFTGKKLDIRYLKPLIHFIDFYKSIHIFSTNYDICVETFCEENDKKYFDGFIPSWDFSNIRLLMIENVMKLNLHRFIVWMIEIHILQ